MFEKVEVYSSKIANSAKRLTRKTLGILGKILSGIFLIAIVIIFIVMFDLISDDALNYKFMEPLYSFVTNTLENINWFNVYLWVMGLLNTVISIVLWIVLILFLLVAFVELKVKILFITNPTKFRFLKFCRNTLVFYVFFIALYDLSFEEVSLSWLSVIYGFIALVVTLVEDWFHKKRIFYVNTLENESTKVITLSDYFDVKKTYHQYFEATSDRAKMVHMLDENKEKKFALEYYIEYPTKSKIMLVPKKNTTEKEMLYFCKILNNMKLKYSLDSIKELKIRIFMNHDLFEYANYINYDFISGVNRKKYLIQDVFYDIKHYYELGQKDYIK